jgi:peptidoglycan/xylan/chitin deacetylase (PgdA/CDA1 family)
MRQPAMQSQSLYLLYHELRTHSSEYSYAMQASRFAEHVELCARLRQIGTGLRPEITFDDGHLSDFELALPILQQYSLTAHFFITVGWTSSRAGYMGWSDLRALHQAGQTIGAHGWTHTLLTHCNDRELDKELLQARLVLEDKLGTAITTMSLPGGRVNGRVMAACRKAGYLKVYTSQPRVELSDKDAAWLAELLRPESGVLAGLQARDRRKAAVKTLLGDRLYARLWALLNHGEAA